MRGISKKNKYVLRIHIPRTTLVDTTSPSYTKHWYCVYLYRVKRAFPTSLSASQLSACPNSNTTLHPADMDLFYAYANLQISILYRVLPACSPPPYMHAYCTWFH